MGVLFLYTPFLFTTCGWRSVQPSVVHCGSTGKGRNPEGGCMVLYCFVGQKRGGVYKKGNYVRVVVWVFCFCFSFSFLSSFFNLGVFSIDILTYNISSSCSVFLFPSPWHLPLHAGLDLLCTVAVEKSNDEKVQ